MISIVKNTLWVIGDILWRFKLQVPGFALSSFTRKGEPATLYNALVHGLISCFSLSGTILNSQQSFIRTLRSFSSLRGAPLNIKSCSSPRQTRRPSSQSRKNPHNAALLCERDFSRRPTLLLLQAGIRSQQRRNSHIYSKTGR